MATVNDPSTGLTLLYIFIPTEQIYKVRAGCWERFDDGCVGKVSNTHVRCDCQWYGLDESLPMLGGTRIGAIFISDTSK